MKEGGTRQNWPSAIRLQHVQGALYERGQVGRLGLKSSSGWMSHTATGANWTRSGRPKKLGWLRDYRTLRQWEQCAAGVETAETLVRREAIMRKVKRNFAGGCTLKADSLADRVRRKLWNS